MPVPKPIRAVVAEIWGLVVGAGSLALAAIVAVLGAALLAARLSDARGWAALVLVGGVVLALVIAVAESRRTRPDDAVAAPLSEYVNSSVCSR